jgi:hypothetical protein
MANSIMARWRTAAVPALLGVAAAACVGDAEEPSFFLTLSLMYVDETAVGCREAGGMRVDVDSRNERTGALFHDMFPCEAQRAQSQPLPSGPYTVTVRLRNNQGKVVSEKTIPSEIVSRNTTDLQHFIFGVQQFLLSWSIAGPRGALTCPQAGARSVELSGQLPNGDRLLYRFPCETGGGATTAIPLGTYSVQVRLLATPPKDEPMDADVLSLTRPATVVVDARVRAVLPAVTFDVK